ncbi:hypothetical protein FDECE_14250 [Fusarium decemcellulare]|nr:hypothetical protein FDECE_14250 [Fusarium decemcellulare]
MALHSLATNKVLGTAHDPTHHPQPPGPCHTPPVEDLRVSRQRGTLTLQKLATNTSMNQIANAAMGMLSQINPDDGNHDYRGTHAAFRHASMSDKRLQFDKHWGGGGWMPPDVRRAWCSNTGEIHDPSERIVENLLRIATIDKANNIDLPSRMGTWWMSEKGSGTKSQRSAINKKTSSAQPEIGPPEEPAAEPKASIELEHFSDLQDSGFGDFEGSLATPTAGNIHVQHLPGHTAATRSISLRANLEHKSKLKRAISVSSTASAPRKRPKTDSPVAAKAREQLNLSQPKLLTDDVLDHICQVIMTEYGSDDARLLFPLWFAAEGNEPPQ